MTLAAFAELHKRSACLRLRTSGPRAPSRSRRRFKSSRKTSRPRLAHHELDGPQQRVQLPPPGPRAPRGRAVARADRGAQLRELWGGKRALATGTAAPASYSPTSGGGVGGKA